MGQKTRRYYKRGEVVWVIDEKQEGTVKDIIAKDLEVVVDVGGEEKVLNLWEIDKIKYDAKERLLKEKESQKTTYFASVKGGVIPTKSDENAGRDCYARLEPTMRNGKKIYEMFIKRFTVAKIPLGFASYLDREDFLSLKHERSSIGSTGLISVSGLIDSTYQGEVTMQVIPLVHDIVISSEVDERYLDEATNTYFIPYDTAICQAVLISQSITNVEHIPYDDLLKKPSTRGTGGWGSSGK